VAYALLRVVSSQQMSIMSWRMAQTTGCSQLEAW